MDEKRAPSILIPLTEEECDRALNQFTPETSRALAEADAVSAADDGSLEVFIGELPLQNDRRLPIATPNVDERADLAAEIVSASTVTPEFTRAEPPVVVDRALPDVTKVLQIAAVLAIAVVLGFARTRMTAPQWSPPPPVQTSGTAPTSPSAAHAPQLPIEADQGSLPAPSSASPTASPARTPARATATTIGSPADVAATRTRPKTPPSAGPTHEVAPAIALTAPAPLPTPLPAPAAVNTTAQPARPLPPAPAPTVEPPREAPPTTVPAPTASAAAASTAAGPAAVTPSPAPVVADRRAVEDVLSRYRAAFGRLDPSATQAVWPTVESRALRRAFDRLQEQELEFDACGIDINGLQALASCNGTARFVPKIGNRNMRSEPRVWVFYLRKGVDGWIIESVDSR
jgi:hypothetical protein